MSLFEVPGWTVPNAPVASSSNTRKRKRPGDPEADAKIQSAAVNVDKLMAKLEREEGKDDQERGKKGKRKNERKDVRDKDVKGKGAKGRDVKGKGRAREVDEEAERGTDVAKPAAKKKQRIEEKEASSLAAPAKTSKKQKKKGMKEAKDRVADPPSTSASKPPARAEKKTSPAKGLTALQANMKQSLDGARFRWINETLYKSKSEDAVQMMRENPSVFSEYHTGFRHQVHSWPVNPVSHYISTLSARPAGTVIADLGCGDAALARALVPKGLTVLSFDLVSDGAFVVEADTCSKIPLPGSEDAEEDEEGGAQIVDVVVCALSLMSINWVGCIREAWRILKDGGELKIAEVASRFSELEAFVSLVCGVGFWLRSKDDSNTHFTLFEFTKVSRQPKSDKEWAKMMECGSILKPCEYKRR